MQKISNHLKVGVKYTERLGDVLRNRVRYLVRRMKELKGGAPRQQFFTKSWILEVEANELEVTESQSTTADLKSTIAILETQKRVNSLSSHIKWSGKQKKKNGANPLKT